MASSPGIRPVQRVAIIGAGFSGALQAINLLRHDGPEAILIERRNHMGRGVAYSAAHPDHLLNVRAGNMSAFPDEPDHFVRWLAANRPDIAPGFVPRIVYGDYLGSLLADARERAGSRLQVVHGEARDVEIGADGATVLLEGGRRIPANAVILAAGNLPPHEPPQLAAAGLGPDLYAPDPWAADIAEGLEDQDTVLAIGSGLTMIDVALLLAARGFKGRIVAISRRGLLPRAHADTPPPPRLPERPSLSASRLVRFVREQAHDHGWRGAVDSLRPYTQDMWRSASAEERSRFLRHLRPWWDVHRHRLAPGVAAAIDRLQKYKQLQCFAGKFEDFTSTGDGVQVRWRARGESAARSLTVRRIVNCSGPQGNLERTTEPLLRTLTKKGLIRPDEQHLGIDVNPQAETIAADGAANAQLLALGPMTRGAFWEIVAVPDIRVQTWTVARRLANAHWVGGEGL